MIRVEISVMVPGPHGGRVRNAGIERLHIAHAGSAGAEGLANYKVWAGDNVEREADTWVFAHAAQDGAAALVGKAIGALKDVGCLGECTL